MGVPFRPAAALSKVPVLPLGPCGWRKPPLAVVRPKWAEMSERNLKKLDLHVAGECQPHRAPAWGQEGPKTGSGPTALNCR